MSPISFGLRFENEQQATLVEYSVRRGTVFSVDEYRLLNKKTADAQAAPTVR